LGIRNIQGEAFFRRESTRNGGTAEKRPWPLGRYARDNENFVLVVDADIFVLAKNLVIG
jgi:hypothetical protein